MTALWVEVAANADVILAGLLLIAYGVALAGFVALLVRLRRRYRQRNETVHPPVSGGHVVVPHDSFGLNIVRPDQDRGRQ